MFANEKDCIIFIVLFYLRLHKRFVKHSIGCPIKFFKSPINFGLVTAICYSYECGVYVIVKWTFDTRWQQCYPVANSRVSVPISKTMRDVAKKLNL